MSQCVSLSQTKEWEYMQEVFIVLESEVSVDIAMSRMITQLYYRIGKNLLRGGNCFIRKSLWKMTSSRG